MRLKSLCLLLVLLFIAWAGAGRRARTPPGPGAPLARVYHANRAIPVGTTIPFRDMEAREIPASRVPSTAITDLARAVGWVSVAPIGKGDLFLWQHVHSPPWSDCLSILPGRQEVSIPIGTAYQRQDRVDIDVETGTIEDVEVLRAGPESTVLLMTEAQAVAIGNSKKVTIRTCGSVSVDGRTP
ncbi:MAG TPA: SAF domain-containing protein [Isosphaeraceae bacterium]|jgi:hypothetical protein